MADAEGSTPPPPVSHTKSDNDDKGATSATTTTTEDSKPTATVATTPSRLLHAAKPALKKDTAFLSSSGTQPQQNPTNTATTEEGEKKHLQWDEAAIQEHDLLRGTRMKIDEPNTPYAQYDSDASSERAKSPANQRPTLSWDVLQNRLDSVAAVREAYPSSPSAGTGGETDHSDVDEEQRKKEMREMEFKEHRKRHYNEMEAVRRFRQQHGDFSFEDEDGDADDET
jgi:protein phosphatase inhibitor 2